MSNFTKTIKKKPKQFLPKNNEKKYKKHKNIYKFSNDIKTLQHNAGNQTVQRLFESGMIQRKLTVGKSDDKYEKEADQTADKVMRMADTSTQEPGQEKDETLQTKPIGAQITPLVQRQGESDKEEKPVQAKSNRSHLDIDDTFSSDLKEAQSEGRIMSQQERAYFEPKFGADFSQVRLHTGNKSHQLARSIHAKAFTKGEDIYFGAGKYNTQSHQGRHLMAHELTHTIQQKGMHQRTSQISRKENNENEKPRDKAVKAVGKATVKAFLKTSMGKNVKLKLKKFAKTPGGITLASIGGLSTLSYMFAKNMEIPQGLVDLVPKFAKIDLNEHVTLSFQPIYKGQFGKRPKAWGGMINLTITNW